MLNRCGDSAVEPWRNVYIFNPDIDKKRYYGKKKKKKVHICVYVHTASVARIIGSMY